MASAKESMRIADMGGTSSRKSTLTNVASGSRLAVGEPLESCTNVVGLELSAHSVQDEIVNQETALVHISAGTELTRKLKEQAESHSEAIDDLCLGIEAARVAENEETKGVFQQEARKAREKIERIRRDLEQMVIHFATENSRLEDENRRYQGDFGKQKADAEHKAQFERERRARKIAEAGKRRAEEQLAIVCEIRGHEKKEHGRREDGKRERERQEKETQKHEKKACSRKESGGHGREARLREAVELVKKELERTWQELEEEGLEEEAKVEASGSGCLIQ